MVHWECIRAKPEENVYRFTRKMWLNILCLIFYFGFLEQVNLSHFLNSLLEPNLKGGSNKFVNRIYSEQMCVYDLGIYWLLGGSHICSSLIYEKLLFLIVLLIGYSDRWGAHLWNARGARHQEQIFLKQSGISAWTFKTDRYKSGTHDVFHADWHEEEANMWLYTQGVITNYNLCASHCLHLLKDTLLDFA